MSRSHKVNRKVKLFTSNKLVEDRKQFKYLGSWISEDGYCETDIKTRTAMGRRPSWIIRAYREAMYCGQTVGRIKMKLGTEVGLSPGHIVLDGDPAPLPQKGTAAPLFGPCLLWPNGHPSQLLLSSCCQITKQVILPYNQTSQYFQV